MAFNHVLALVWMGQDVLFMTGQHWTHCVASSQG